MATSAKTAIFGGTFDPVHNGHLALAKATADELGLRRVIFVPAGNPPFKGATIASFDDRVRMLELAITDPRFEVSRIEQPVEGGPPSYSVNTVEQLRSEGPLAFIVGADAFADLPKWHRWRDLAAMVEFVVVPREGAGVNVPEGVKAHVLAGVVSPVSSSLVREQIERRAQEIPVPAAVLKFIRERGLFAGRHEVSGGSASVHNPNAA